MKSRYIKIIRIVLVHTFNNFCDTLRTPNTPIRMLNNNFLSFNKKKFWRVNLIYSVYAVTILILLTAALPVRAEESRTVHLKAAALDQVLYDDDFTVTACPDNVGSTILTVNAWCAVDQLAVGQGWTASSTWYASGVLLNNLNKYDGSDGNYWLWFSNGEVGITALNQHVLTDGEKLLLTYGTSPLKVTVASSSPPINATTTVSTLYFDVFSWQWLLAASSSLMLNGQEVANDSGSYDLWTATTTPYEITAKKLGFLDSDSLTLTPVLPNLKIHLQIETASSTLLNNNLNVSACEKNLAGGVYTINGRCALEQSGLPTSWTEWSSDSFLDSIDNVTNNQDGNGIYWQWFSNLDYGQTALNNHLLMPDEQLLLIYGKYPLRLTTATTTPLINATSSLTLEQFGLDSSWNPVWSVAASSTININGQVASSTDGTFQLMIATTSPYTIYSSKAGYVDSQILVLTGVAQNSSSTPPDNSNNSGSGSSGIDIGGSQTHQSVNINQAVNFLISQQNSDGSIGTSLLYSDWAAMALVAAQDSSAKDKLKNYLLNAGYTAGLSRAADLERRAMALEALGINPYNGTAVDFIGKIVAAFDGTQVGDPTIYNDDIFALFPLLKAGYTGKDAIIQTTIDFILSKQSPNGSWDNVDLTAAVVQAFKLSQNKGNLSQTQTDAINLVLDKAKNYLHNSQQPDGGFGNAISTSWAVQAVIALGESASGWQVNGQNPLDFLVSRQQNDGGFESVSTEMGTRIWTTAYAIPAALGKTWEMILNSFAKPPQDQSNLNVINGISSLSNLVATSTPINASSTPIIVTSTPVDANNTPIYEIATSSPTASATSTVATAKDQKPTKSSSPIVKGYSAEFDTAIRQSANQVENQTKLNQTDKPTDLFTTIDQPNSANSNSQSSQDMAIKIIFYSTAGLTILSGLFLLVKFIMTLL